MFINTDSMQFIPKNFVILDFYGKTTCIAWNQNEFICFQYMYKDITEKLQVFKAPAVIKNVRSYNERVFILCFPAGIYKLTDNFEFLCLNENGIDMGLDFNEIFTINNGNLVLENKNLKSFKSLFSISTKHNLHVLILNYENTDNLFFKLFLPDNYNNNENFCLISNDKKLFKIFDETIHIIYTCDYLINEIKSVERHEKIIGLFLKTDSNIVIFVHVLDNKLKYDKILLEENVRTVCAVFDINIENELLIVYSDATKTYYSRRIIVGDFVQEVQIDEKYYESFTIYKSKFLIYLSNSKELLQISIEQLRNSYFKNINDFINLKSYMLRGIEKTIEKICDKAIELKLLRDEEIKNEDILKRINLFIHKQNIKFCSDDNIKRVLNQIFFISNFKKILPNNSIVLKKLKFKEKTIFSIKNVKNYDTIIEMPIFTSILTSKLNISTDVITHKYDNGLWCLIKNYIQNPVSSKSKRLYLSSKKLNFIRYKLIILVKLIKTKNFSFEVISKIKKDVRLEIED
jgi:hypothetical protein